MTNHADVRVNALLVQLSCGFTMLPYRLTHKSNTWINPRNTRNFIVHWVPVGLIWPHVCSIVSWMHSIWKFYQEQ